MPTRSYYFPPDFKHLEALLLADDKPPSEEKLDHFRILGLPPIISEGSLSMFLGISPKTIHSITRKTGKHYRSFNLRKKDGTNREIRSPRTYLKVIQWWINDNLLDQIEQPEFVFGFVRGRNAVGNANYHAGASHLLNVDIRDFFPSISEDQVAKVFFDLGYTSEVAELLAKICCLNERVPQGAPTSPNIANLVLRKLDASLTSLAANHGIKYSRYADDLTFSSKEFIDPEFYISIAGLVVNEGFELKKEKTRFSGHGNRMEVTGIVINQTLQPTRGWRRNTRAKVHQLSMKDRLVRRDIYYLHGIKGVACQFLDSPSMQNLMSSVSQILEVRKSEVVSIGSPTFLPLDLTLMEAEILARLAPYRKNREIASSIGMSVSFVKKRLTAAYRKIGVENRYAAYNWARINL